MKKTLYLHAGTEKTGSTSIQHLLSSNIAQFAKHGIHVVESAGLGSTGALRLATSLSPLMTQIREREDRESYRVQEEVAAEIRSSDKEVFIISAEHFHSRLTASKQILALRSLMLSAGITEVFVIFFVRNQIDLVRSHHSTVVKGGQPASYPAAFKNCRWAQLIPRNLFVYGNYNDLLIRWSEVFGKKQLIVVKYEGIRDVTTSFMNIVAPGVSLEGFQRPARLNSHLNRNSLYTLGRFNQKFQFSQETLRWVHKTIGEMRFPENTDPMPFSIQLRIWLAFLFSNLALTAKFPQLRGIWRRGFRSGPSSWYQKATSVELDLMDVVFSLGLKKLRPSRTPPTILLGVPESPSSTGGLRQGFDFGFHEPEPWGCWTSELLAGILVVFPTQDSVNASEVEIEVVVRVFQSFPNAPRPQVYLNNFAVDLGELSQEFTRTTVRVPADVVAFGMTNRIMFSAGRLVVPNQVSDNPDARRLGLGIASVTIRYVQETPDQQG